nr:cytochrome c3 family protein [Prolixibacteraceae bacterium]
SGWSPSQFNHATTGFELSGGHAQINQCSECHIGSLENTSPECNACHNDDFNQSANPNHQTLGIPVSCEECHTTNPDWQPATFNIHDDYYALTGAHASIRNNCAVCHNGDYNNTANTCYECHDSEYNNSVNPDHQAAGFPVECESCHSQSSWEPATFDHDSQYFPIYSGEHRGEWNSCSDCHTQTNNFALFSCIDCHEHNQSEMNSEHDDVSGYAYNSASCLSCHPNGRED